MKNSVYLTGILSLIALVLTGCVTTPEIAGADASREVQYVVEIKGKTQKEIYDGTKLWVAENFTSAKAVIDFEDPEQGILICNGVLPNIVLESGMTSITLSAAFKMKAEAKDDRMRLTFNNFRMTNRNSNVMYQTEINQIVAQLNQFGSRIESYLQSNGSSTF